MPAKKTTAKKKAATKKASGKTKSDAVKKTSPGKKKVAAKKTPARKTTPATSTAGRKTTTEKTSVGTKAAAAKTKSSTAVKKAAAPAKEASALSGFKKFEPYQEKRGEEYMNERQVEHFRNILLAWKRELMEEVDRTVHHMKDEAANFPDPNDRATQEADFTMELRTRDRERKLIKKIDESLRDLEEGEYGFCEVCGVDIGIRRLEARPTATLCIDCKTLDEIRERQMG